MFSDTGRGLQTLTDLDPGDTLVNIPLSALISRDCVEEALNSQFKNGSLALLSTQTLLSFWLLREKQLGLGSQFHPYLQSLPSSYTNPYFCSVKEKQSLPQYLLNKIEDQESEVVRCYQRLVNSLNCDMNHGLSEFAWAWFTVNTRAVYLDQDPRFHHQNNTQNKSEDCLALVPFLDLLNHDSSVEVRAGVSPDNTGYRIISQTRVDKYDQVFINYGPHDNTKLLLEYGFW